VYANGFGFRDPELKLEVTTTTNFSLASMTKSFTALVVGLMVEDGIIEWDTPVCERVTEFELSDSDLSSKVTFRDMLSHRTGLAEKHELWTSGEYMANEILEHIYEMEVTGPLRSHFEYSNVLYIASAELVGKLTGTPWDVLATQRLLHPMGMNNTGFSVEQLLQSINYSFSFSNRNGTYIANEFPGPEHNVWYFTRGSGSMYSNVENMARWMVFQLNEGQYEGNQLVSISIVRTTHEQQIPIDDPPFYLNYSGISHHAYGMGWYLDEYWGHQRVHHGGASMGFSNYITLFPEDRIGIVILSNRQVMMPVELMYYASDILLELPQKDWKTCFEEYVPEN
jgi:CubicO group peptidase (beta-lactamase class C family)